MNGSPDQPALFQVAAGLRRVRGAVSDAHQAAWHGGSSVGRPVVLAFGGNALLPDPERPEESEALAREFATAVRRVLPQDAGMVLVHGNGPQVGMILLRVESTRDQMPGVTLDVMVAETQGSIGYQLSRALRGAFASDNVDIEVATVGTQVVVDSTDPAFEEPTKPVGPYYSEERLSEVEEIGWDLVFVPGRGWRRVVPSPTPLDVVELHTIADSAGHGHIVIAGGGGGIPVSRSDGGELTGVEAVIDKDRTASLLAMQVDAARLVILTAVPAVYRGFGGERQEAVAEMTIAESEQLRIAGEFPPGSMGPKVEAAAAFVAATGRTALITDVEHLDEALADRAGTRIVP